MAVTLAQYTDYLLSTPKYATATGMSRAYQGAFPHDQVTYLLTSSYFDSRTLWRAAKPLIRKTVAAGDDSGVLIVDDSIVDKPHSEENALINWHYDHTRGRAVKGINFMTVLYSYGEQLQLPLQVHLVEKTESYFNKKRDKWALRSKRTKNAHLLDMLRVCTGQVDFRYILADSWFASAATFRYIRRELGKHAIFALKSNRKVLVEGAEDYMAIDQLADWPEQQPLRVRLNGYAEPVLIVRQVFKNGDGSRGVLYLVCTDLTLDWEQITTLYKKRWKVEVYHKSLKQHTALAGSPTKNIDTQSNHFFAAIAAYIKLEKMRLLLGGNHFKIMSALTDIAVIATLNHLQNLTA